MTRQEIDNRRTRANERPRDEYGRFESDWDRRGRGYHENSRDDYETGQRRYGASTTDSMERESWRPDYENSEERYYSGDYRRSGSGYRQQSGRGSYGQQDTRGYGNDDPSGGREYNDPNSGGDYRYEAANYRPNTRYGNGGSTSNRYNTSGVGHQWENESQRGYGQFGSNYGQFAGRGPKGYRRSDERIEEEINEALTQDSNIDAGEIEVKVSNGEVTLGGTVSDRRFKRMAENIAEQCSGVQDVRNEIRVQRESDSSGMENQGQQHMRTKTGSGSKSSEAKTA